MSKRATVLLVYVLSLSVAPGVASAQFGDWGWGGWGWGMSGTIEGHALQGAGILAAGLGQFNRDTAEANAINADTVMQMNEYLYQSFRVSQENRLRRIAAQKQMRTDALAQIEETLLYNPTPADVTSGNALNTVLRQLRNPSIPTSMIFEAGQGLNLPGELMRTVPLMFSSHGIVISIDRLTAQDRWPLPLLADDYKELREKYARLVEEVKARPEDEPVPDAKIVEGIGIIKQIREKARESLMGREYAEAERFLKGHLAMLQMARQPDIKGVLEQASRLDTIPISSVITFMESYNLEFGAARTAEERALYTGTLFPLIRQVRDGVEQRLGARIQTSTQQALAGRASRNPTALAAGLPWEGLTNVSPPVATATASPPAKP